MKDLKSEHAFFVFFWDLLLGIAKTKLSRIKLQAAIRKRRGFSVVIR